MGQTASNASRMMNHPGHWDVMISQSRRSPKAQMMAEVLYAELRSRDFTVWLDVKMSDSTSAAMEEVRPHPPPMPHHTHRNASQRTQLHPTQANFHGTPCLLPASPLRRA